MCCGQSSKSHKKTICVPKEKVKGFLEEIEIIKAVNHPNILTIYEFADNGQSYQLVMEYISEC